MGDAVEKHGHDHGPRGTDPVPLPRLVHIKVASDLLASIAGNGAFIWKVPLHLDRHWVTHVESYVTTAGGGSEITQIRNATQSDDILSTRLTVVAGELNSEDGGATQPVIDPVESQVFHKDHIAIDVDSSGGGLGLGVWITLEFGIDPDLL